MCYSFWYRLFYKGHIEAYSFNNYSKKTRNFWRFKLYIIKIRNWWKIKRKYVSEWYSTVPYKNLFKRTCTLIRRRAWSRQRQRQVQPLAAVFVLPTLFLVSSVWLWFVLVSVPRVESELGNHKPAATSPDPVCVFVSSNWSAIMRIMTAVTITLDMALLHTVISM